MFAFEELEKEFPFMNWTLFLRSIIGDNEEIDGFPEAADKFMISSPQYLKGSVHLVH